MGDSWKLDNPKNVEDAWATDYALFREALVKEVDADPAFSSCKTENEFSKALKTKVSAMREGKSFVGGLDKGIVFPKVVSSYPVRTCFS